MSVASAWPILPDWAPKLLIAQGTDGACRGTVQQRGTNTETWHDCFVTHAHCKVCLQESQRLCALSLPWRRAQMVTNLQTTSGREHCQIAQKNSTEINLLS